MAAEIVWDKVGERNASGFNEAAANGRGIFQHIVLTRALPLQLQ